MRLKRRHIEALRRVAVFGDLIVGVHRGCEVQPRRVRRATGPLARRGLVDVEQMPGTGLLVATITDAGRDRLERPRPKRPSAFRDSRNLSRREKNELRRMGLGPLLRARISMRSGDVFINLDNPGGQAA